MESHAYFSSSIGILDILQISEEQFGITIIVLGFIAGILVTKKQNDYYKKEIIIKMNDKDNEKKENDHCEEK